MPSTTVRADQSEKAWCNWLLVTQHKCCIYQKDVLACDLCVGLLLAIEVGGPQNLSADSKHSRLLRLEEEEK